MILNSSSSSNRKSVQAIRQLPESFQINQWIDQLILIENVEEGLKNLENSNVLSHDEVVKQASSWFTT